MNSKDYRNIREAYLNVYNDDLREEQEFKSWVTELLDEGYDLSDYTWDEMYDIYNKESYDLYDIILSHLIDEGYADTNENALVIMTNMSEEWRESILLDERIRDSPRPDKEEYMKRREIMRQNAKQAEREASTNNLIRSRKPPEPRKPDRVGNPDAAPPSGEGVAQMLNPENKPPRPREREFYKPPEGTENLKDRTSKIAPFGTVKPPFIPPAAPKKIR